MAILLAPIADPQEKIWTPTPIIQLLPLTAYYTFVVAVPFSARTFFFITAVILIRLLLFCPFVLPAVVPEGGGKSFLTPRKASWTDAVPFQFIGILSALLLSLQTFLALRNSGFQAGSILGAINDNPAVSALGYDCVLSLISLGTWAVVVGGDVS